MRGRTTLVLFAAGVLAAATAFADDRDKDRDRDHKSPPPPQSVTIPVLQLCTPPFSEVCNPPFRTLLLPQGSKLQITFQVAPTHCSSIKTELFINGGSKGQSPFLFWFGEPNLPQSFTWNVHVRKNVPLVLELQATGRVGGCNVGSLGSWAGTLTISQKSGEGDDDDDHEHEGGDD